VLLIGGTDRYLSLLATGSPSRIMAIAAALDFDV